MEENDLNISWEDKYLLPKQFDFGMMDEVMSSLGYHPEGSSWYIKDELYEEKQNVL